MMMPGLMVLMRAPRSAHRTASAMMQSVAALGELVGVECVGDEVALEHGELQQVVGRNSCQRRVLLGRQSAEAMPGLGCDHDACAAASDHLAELLEQNRRSVQINRKDDSDRRLTR
jgi:site-specific recombinase XerC